MESLQLQQMDGEQPFFDAATNDRLPVRIGRINVWHPIPSRQNMQ
jgi:hypothetical protein